VIKCQCDKVTVSRSPESYTLWLRFRIRDVARS